MKYKDPEIEVSRMWKVRTQIVPVIIGALGTIKMGLDQNLQLLPGHWSAVEPQKLTLTSTAYGICKVQRFGLLLRAGLNQKTAT